MALSTNDLKVSIIFVVAVKLLYHDEYTHLIVTKPTLGYYCFLFSLCVDPIPVETPPTSPRNILE